MINLANLPTRHLFYLGWSEHPIALPLGNNIPKSEYRVIETRVKRIKEDTTEYYLFEHLVEHVFL